MTDPSATMPPMPQTPSPTTPRTGEVRRLAPSHSSVPLQQRVLLRLPVVAGLWAEDLPPVPTGMDVTASFSDADAAGEHADALALLGYRIVAAQVGVDPAADTAPSVDLLMPRDFLDRWPMWRDALMASGGRVYDLSFGPVARLLGDVLAPHLARA